MGTRLRVLGPSDLDRAMAFLAERPVENLFVLSRVAAQGVDRLRLGCDMLGFERDGELTALCHAGSNVVPIGDDPDAIDHFVHRLGHRRRSTSIMGRADLVRPLWEGLGHLYGNSWRRVRELRPRQPLMVVEGEALVPGDPRVRRITMTDFEPYFEAAVAMYTEEVGVSPLGGGDSYRTYVRSLVVNGRAFGIVEDGRVLFKSDIGSVFGPYCQIQGVWLAPELRGQGVSIPAMAQVVNLVHPQHPVQSLYVNDFNTRARRLYQSVGFTVIGEFATVLY